MERPLTTIRVDLIDADATKVVRRLQRHGHEAFLVGGCVRDMLLDRVPKDFDVATSATPQQIKKLFRNCRIIGRRFRLAHIYFGSKVIETSTFRAPPEINPEARGEERIIWRDNVFGTAEEDAHRRDFTINGLFFDPVANKVIDFVCGQKDLQDGCVRTIGDPQLSLQEDPVRILRAIKFASRLGMRIEPKTLQAMVDHRRLIARCSVPRVLEEVYRLLGSGSSLPSVRLLHETGVLAVLFPEIGALLDPPRDRRIHGAVPFILWGQGRRPLPGPEPEELPRDAEPEQMKAEDQEDDQAANDAYRAAFESLLIRLLGVNQGAARQRSAQLIFKVLKALDRGMAAAPLAPSHAFLLGALLMGLAREALDERYSTQEAMTLLDELVRMVALRLGISRKDRQEATALLQAQRRMVAPRGRSRPMVLVKRSFFPDALKLLALLNEAAGGVFGDTLRHWYSLSSQPSAGNRRRRHRRRGRRAEKTA